MIILGVNAYHGDSSACLLVDGQLVAAAEEERFRRLKHWAGVPSEAIKYCLKHAGVRLTELQHVAINSDPKANLYRKIRYALTGRPSPKLVFSKVRNARKRTTVGQDVAGVFEGDTFSGDIHYVEHHLAHLASGFLVSPYENAVNVSIDGFGDFVSTAWGTGHNNNLSIDGRVYFPHSMGIFYETLTHFLGFRNYGDEYKVMGLAPYGEPRYMAEMRDIVWLQDDGVFRLNLDYFGHHLGKVQYKWDGGVPRADDYFTPKMEELLGHSRRDGESLTQHHMDIACSTQAMYEEAFFHLLNKLYDRYGLKTLTLAGGCAMNSVANGKIVSNTPFKDVYVQSAPGDAGGAIGAAFVVWHRLSKEKRHFVMDHAYFGPSFRNGQIEGLLAAKQSELEAQACTTTELQDEGVLCQRVARAIADGKVIGWFHGRMEWGPRALGNRSILCDPRRADMKEILNSKIKRRESFRPFAPSILREHVQDWFEMDDDVPFMMKVFQVRQGQRDRIPAVTHVDGSGRLQTVHRHTNERYYRLIENFYALTGVPMVLNTSFNENEPIVCRPDEAMDCFLRTRMDLLVLGDFCIERTP